MKLKYEFEIIMMGEQYCAVPVGQDGMKINSVLQINEETKSLMEILKKDVTKEELIVEMSKIYEVSEKVITEAVEPVIANYHILIKKDE